MLVLLFLASTLSSWFTETNDCGYTDLTLTKLALDVKRSDGTFDFTFNLAVTGGPSTSTKFKFRLVGQTTPTDTFDIPVTFDKFTGADVVLNVAASEFAKITTDTVLDVKLYDDAASCTLALGTHTITILTATNAIVGIANDGKVKGELVIPVDLGYANADVQTNSVCFADQKVSGTFTATGTKFAYEVLNAAADKLFTAKTVVVLGKTSKFAIARGFPASTVTATFSKVVDATHIECLTNVDPATHKLFKYGGTPAEITVATDKKVSFLTTDLTAGVYLYPTLNASPTLPSSTPLLVKLTLTTLATPVLTLATAPASPTLDYTVKATEKLILQPNAGAITAVSETTLKAKATFANLVFDPATVTTVMAYVSTQTLGTDIVGGPLALSAASVTYTNGTPTAKASTVTITLTPGYFTALPEKLFCYHDGVTPFDATKVQQFPLAYDATTASKITAAVDWTNLDVTKKILCYVGKALPAPPVKNADQAIAGTPFTLHDPTKKPDPTPASGFGTIISLFVTIASIFLAIF